MKLHFLSYLKIWNHPCDYLSRYSKKSNFINFFVLRDLREFDRIFDHGLMIFWMIKFNLRLMRYPLDDVAAACSGFVSLKVPRRVLFCFLCNVCVVLSVQLRQYSSWVTVWNVTVHGKKRIKKKIMLYVNASTLF